MSDNSRAGTADTDRTAVLRWVIESILSDGVLHPEERVYVGIKARELGVPEQVALAMLDDEVSRRGTVTILAPDTSTEPEPVEVLVNRGRTLCIHESGIIECQIRNSTDQRFSGLTMEMSSKLPVEQPLERQMSRELEPGRIITRRFDVVPGISGEAQVFVKLAFKDAHSRYFAYHAHALVSVNRQPLGSVGSVVYNIAGSKLVGVDMSASVAVDMSSRPAPEPRAVPSSSDQSERWERINLEVDAEAIAAWRAKSSAEQPIRLVGEMASAGRFAAGELRAVDGQPARRIHLISKRTISIGRAGDLNDIVLVFLPASVENAERSRGISREHCCITVRDDRLVLQSLSNAGTWVQARPVEAGSEVPLQDASPIEVGRDRMRLWLRIFRGSAAGPRPGALGAASLTRVDNWPHEEYCLVIREARIGRNRQNPIVIDHSSVSEVHARLVYSNGAYQVEDLGSESGTWVEGQRLNPGETWVLGAKAHVRFGQVAWVFSGIENRRAD